MANWAIVIGIDRDWTERACLKGAVADALRIREWLLDPAGGNVPEENMALIPQISPGGTFLAPLVMRASRAPRKGSESGR
jgi:hypothetical protein